MVTCQPATILRRRTDAPYREARPGRIDQRQRLTRPYPSILHGAPMRPAALLAVTLLGSTLSFACEAAVSSIDYLVDGSKYLQQWTTVNRCNLHNARAGFLSCYVYSKNDPAMGVGTIIVDGDTVARDDLRRALNDCAGSDIAPRCWVNISGTPSIGTLGDKNSPEIDNAQLEWLPR